MQDRERCRTSKKISKTVEITHAVMQGQVPNIAKTDEIPEAQFMPRRGTTNSCAETMPNAQEIQIGMHQRSAVRERRWWICPLCRAGARDSEATWLQATEVADSTALRSSARRTERAGARRKPCMLNDNSGAKVGLEPEGDDTVHRQDRWCSQWGEAPDYDSSQCEARQMLAIQARRRRRLPGVASSWRVRVAPPG